MEDAISLVSSSSNENESFLHEGKTLFEKIENKAKNKEINNLNKNLKDKKYQTLISSKKSIKEDGNIPTDFTSKNFPTYSTHDINNFLNFDNDNDNQLNSITNFANTNICGIPEINKDEMPKFENIDVNRNKYKSDKILLGKKRNLEEKKVTTNNETIFDEIIKLSKNYDKKKEKIPSFKIFQESSGIFESHATVVINKIPSHIVYFYRDIISKIYLIREQKFIENENENEIYQILSLIKDCFLKKICQ